MFSGHWLSAESAGKDRPQQILSVQRSVIMDYKAGRISLDDFKKKVLVYTN